MKTPHWPLISAATAMIACLPTAPAWSAEALPGAKKDQAGIIILDGRAPPTQSPAGNVATGIGAGGCAACDQAEKVQKAAKEKASLKTTVPKNTGISPGDCTNCVPAQAR